MRWTLRRGALLLAMALCGCKGEPPEDDELTLRRNEDWVDTGRLAACELNPNPSTPCGEPGFFTLDGCDEDSLAHIPSEGVYTSLYRFEPDAPNPAYPAVASFRISKDGSQDYLLKYKSRKQVGSNGFFLSAKWPSGASTDQHALVACRATKRRIHGCFVYCRNGWVTSKGTFMAERAEWPEGEVEASGLELVSESRVSQGRPVDVYVTKGHAYVVSINAVDRVGGLTVFDVSDKAHPVLKKVIHFPGNSYWNGVWAKDDALYVASNNMGAMVFDISQPDNPQYVRSYPQSNAEITVHTVFVDGNRLYAMSTDPIPKTFIFDVSSPLTPVLLGEYVGSADDSAYPHDAFAFEGRLYVNHWSTGYHIVDVSTPASPKRLGGYSYPFVKSHANAVGRYGARLIAFEGSEAWAAHLRVLDVTEPEQPKLIGEYRLAPRASIHNMVLKGTRLYVAYYQHGVRVLDVSTPEHPKEVAHYNTYRESDPNRGRSFYEGAIGIRVPGDGYVYAVDDSRGLLIFPEPP